MKKFKKINFGMKGMMKTIKESSPANKQKNKT